MGDYREYKDWLRANERASLLEEQELAKESLEDLKNGATYQTDCKVNGEDQPMCVIRESTYKAKVTVMDGDNLCIGDFVETLGERWLCMEIQLDEYGIRTGEIWMCNFAVRYQDFDGNVIEKWIIIDDGSYLTDGDKSVSVSDGHYTCYASYDDESRYLYLDKRLAIGTMYNSKGKEVLSVGTIVWVDTRSKNYGEGSHLLSFRLEPGLYSEERDNLEEMICDYIQPAETPADETEPGEEIPGGDTGDSGDTEPADEPKGYVSIDGKSTIRIGTERTYTACVYNEDGSVSDDDTTVSWADSVYPEAIKVKAGGLTAVVTVPLDATLVGETIKLICGDTAGEYTPAEIEVEVIDLG